MSRKKFKISLFFLILTYVFMSLYLYPFDLRVSGDKTLNGNLHYKILTRGKIETIVSTNGLLVSLTCANNYASDDRTCFKEEVYKRMDNAKVSVVYFESKESIYGFKRLNKVISIRDEKGNYLCDKAKDSANHLDFIMITALAASILIYILRES